MFYREIYHREINKSKLIINIIAILVIIAIVTILTIYLTNKKDATYVTNQNENQLINNVVQSNGQNEISSSENNVWVLGNRNNNESAIGQETQSNVQNNEKANNETNNSAEVASNDNKTTTKNEKSNNGVIWLTFDDGPSANITPKVLDILKKENIKATFFVINFSDSNEHLVKRIVEEGHTIGIHGYSHEYSKIYKSKETFMNNVYTLQDRIQKATGVKTMYTRFPGGSSNTVSKKYSKGIMTELTKEMLEKGFKYYDWNISSEDAGSAKTAKDVYNNVTKNLSKKRGNMVLMHDFGANKKGLEALPEIIKYAKKEGYTFAKIDDDTPMYAQHINN